MMGTGKVRVQHFTCEMGKRTISPKPLFGWVFDADRCGFGLLQRLLSKLNKSESGEILLKLD
jgi:hypothetical protein